MSFKVDLPTVEKLIGASNYHQWKATVIVFMKYLEIWEVVSGIDKQKDDTWEKKSNKGLAFLYMNIDQTLHSILQASLDAHAAWSALENRFDRQNLTSFHQLLKSITSLQFVDDDSISDHLTAFDNLWQRLKARSKNSKSSNLAQTAASTFASLTSSDEAKATFLLLTFPKSFDNVIDNLQTKENLTYDDVCNRLMDIDLRKDKSDSKAFYVKHTQKMRDTNTKECTWCKSKGDKHVGHSWQECFKLKKHKESKLLKQKGQPSVSKAKEITTTTVQYLVKSHWKN